MKSHIKYSSMIRDWYTSGDKQSGDRLRILLSNYNSSIIGYMTGGSFWTGLLIILNADDAFIGILAMIPALANIIQLFSPLVLERFARRKRMIISLRAVSFILQTVVIGIIPIFPMQSQSKLTILLLVFLLTQAISAFINPGVQAFLLPSYGEGKTRPAFFSFINATNGIISLTLALIAGKVMDILKANGLEYQGLLGLRVIAFLVALFDLYLYSKIKEYPYSDTRERFTIKEMFTLPFAERAYMRSVLACVIYNFSSMFMGNYLSVYLLNDLQIDYSYLNLINFLSIPFSLLFAPVWKKLQWRMGWFKTLSLALIMVPVYYIGIAFTQKTFYGRTLLRHCFPLWFQPPAYLCCSTG